MDTESFEQTHLNTNLLGDSINHLKEGMTSELLSHKDEPVGAELPIAVELKVAETGPGFRGDTATPRTKPATLETGLGNPGPFVYQ